MTKYSSGKSNEGSSVNRIVLVLIILSVLSFSLIFVTLIFSVLTNLSLQSITTDTKIFKTICNNPNVSFSEQLINLNLNNKNFIDLATKKVTYFGKQGISLEATIGNKINYDDYKSIIIRNLQSNVKVIQFDAISRAANIELTLITKYYENSITCNNYNWKIVKWNNPADQEFEDCFSLTDAYWYGGSEVSNQQYWPINQQDFGTYKPYLSGVFAKSSAVLERYWLSSSGIAITVDYKTPLFVLKNKTNICLLGSSKQPYNRDNPSSLNYDVCQIDASVSASNYMNKLHLFMINNYLSKPSGVPDELMFKRPIWSTWAVYKKFINDKRVEEFAKDILTNNYTHSQLEIDDKWQTAYGDFTFDTSKFPNMQSFIKGINELGFRTTLWVHPFVNLGANNFLKWALAFFTVRATDGLRPSFTSWWDGDAAFILDTTNKNASDYFVNELETIRATTGIDSFKFDAGEFEWLPKNGWLANAYESPEQYCSDYARMASRLGPMIEIRVGCRTQDLPVFVRMIDRDSKWGMDNGLKTVLTASLVFSILGYPFVLPDMIGGNAYIFDGDNINFENETIIYPDYELFIRWTQLNAFLPSMQFSIPPWHYNNKTSVPVNQICRDLVNLHESLVYPYLIKYANLSTQTGEPIIRPVWWIDNSDQQSYLVDDQFLVGNDILVAPVVEEHTYQRNIYIPRGNWKYINNTIYSGPKILNFLAPIEVVPYFINMN